jgi:hypothetical protein
VGRLRDGSFGGKMHGLIFGRQRDGKPGSCYAHGVCGGGEGVGSAQVIRSPS